MKIIRSGLIFSLMLALLALLPVSLAETLVFEGVSFDSEAEMIDFGETAVQDLDALADFLARFPNLKQVNMFANQIVAADCDRLAERFPDMKWGWTMKLVGKDHKHLIRTDQTSFSTLHNNRSSVHRDGDFDMLKYCWHLYALDIGHNLITDVSFLYNLPNLRVLIIACNYVTDITPLASLKNLEYAEIFKNRITDLTPVSGLTHLLDLNVCFNAVEDTSCLKQMTWLKRLWTYNNDIYSGTKAFTKDVAAELKAALPDTQVDTTHYSTTGTWRYLDSNQKNRTPHYQKIIETFGDSHVRPSTQYHPFEDSWPFTAEDLEILGDAVPENLR